MAINTSLTGFIPRDYFGAPSSSGKVSRYYIPSGDGTATFIGDMVKLVAQVSSSGTTSDLQSGGMRVAQIAAGITTNIIAGAVVGVEPVIGMTTANQNFNIVYRLASVGQYVYVSDDPNQVYEAQMDDSGGAQSTQLVGSNCDIATVGSGNTNTGQSAMVLSTTSAASGATLPFKIIGFVQDPSQTFNVGDTLIKVLCVVNDHYMKFGTLGMND